MEKRERELAQPGALDAAKQDDPTLAEVITKLTRESDKEIGRTKAQVLKAIAASDLGAMRCSKIDSPALVSFARGLKVLPQTAGNYMAHLGSVFSIARPAWGYPLDERAMADARKVLGKLGTISRSKARQRRPTLAELDQWMEHFGRVRHFLNAAPRRDLPRHLRRSRRRALAHHGSRHEAPRREDRQRPVVRPARRSAAHRVGAAAPYQPHLSGLPP